MTTAEEWYKTVLNDGKSWPESIRDVQRDAYKSGLMKAQLIASSVIAAESSRYAAPNLSGLQYKVIAAIVAAADKLE